jgi:hypothetical protein
LGVAKPRGADGAAGTPSLTSIYPFEAKEFSPWPGEVPAGSSEVYAIVVCGLGDISEPELELSFSLKGDASGEELPLAHSVLWAKPYSREAGEKTWLALFSRLELTGVGPGQYGLKVTAREATTKSETEFVQRLNVR